MTLEVSEIFSNIQGEGIYTGTPMTFIRLAKCNLNCAWCDTKYAKSENGIEMSEEEILKDVNKFNNLWVCITGGEPLLQALTKLLPLLYKNGNKITIETNGTISPDINGLSLVHFWSVSPKLSNSRMEKYLNLEVLKQFSHRPSQFKFVIEEQKDMFEALELIKILEFQTVIFQPQGLLFKNNDKYLKFIEEMVKIVKEGTDFHKFNIRVMPQLHRLIWGQKRGV